ncbi:centromere protein Chl4/mis15/CENP-N [Triangularia verruculosa]|uniref:Centromere protein Chl4/mis15/CENP-N n=1 Tax=Triangularia verruculosa TaxID=2587418 RepID=A0AAN6XUG7_9PEZI|nr:centromere protein Chl4/mis15/CENP-N [Triangularia verruculosa]
MSRISVPTTARLPSSLRVNPSSSTVTKILGRLSRASLISVALDWLDEDNLSLATPYLRPDQEDEDDEDDGDFYPPASSAEELREEYLSLQTRKGSKREILDRIITGDWRHGVSLYQLAIADLQYLYDHPTSQKWSAYKIVPLKSPAEDENGEVEPLEVDRTSLCIPRFHPSLFLKSLQAQILPDIKAHYNLDRHKTLPLLILRIFVIDSPYNTPLSLTSTGNLDTGSKTILIAFPDGSPNIFISKPTSTGPTGASESKSIRALLVEGIPKALSLPRQRVTLQSTSLTTRNLEELLDRKGGTRGNAAGGGWSIYADEKVKESPLSTVLPTPPLSDAMEEEEEQGNGEKKRRARPTTEERIAKRAKLVAQARFGDTGKVDDGKGVERVDLVMEDVWKPTGANADDTDMMDVDEDEGETGGPNVRLTFHGSHVFAGIRQLVECGVIDGEEMPGWMTGEEGVTIGAVRNGRIRGHKGSGL